METGTAIAVKYWIATDQGRNFPDLDGIDEFRRELAADYVSVVRGRPAGAGGLTHLYVEVISSLSLSHLSQILLDGIAFDLIKRGTEKFVLRPFLAAYKKLRDRNKGKNNFIDIGELQIQFQDSLLVIHEFSSDSVVDQLENILQLVARNYETLVLEDGAYPFSIHVPVFEDPDPERPCRFRVMGLIDETAVVNARDGYFQFWGLEYDPFETRVYDVEHQRMLDVGFNTLERHWAELTMRANVNALKRGSAI